MQDTISPESVAVGETMTRYGLTYTQGDTVVNRAVYDRWEDAAAWADRVKDYWLGQGYTVTITEFTFTLTGTRSARQVMRGL